MGLILPLLFLGLMASLSPATIVVFVLVLGTARARVNAVGFLFGWGISLTIVFGASYALAASGETRSSSGRTSVAILEILLGVLLLVVAVRVARRATSPPETEPGPSRWGTTRLVGHMESLTPVGAAVVGVLKQPWAITTAAALVVAHNHTTGILAAIAFVLFTVFSTATVALMFVYYSRNPGEAEARLADLRDRAVSAGPALGSAVATMVGIFLILDGLFGLL